jgi:hypothetical protein
LRLDPPAYLVFSGVLVVSTVVVHKVDELEVVSLTTLEIVGIVSWSDLDSTSTKRHVDSDRVGNDGDSSAVEWVDDEFAVKVGVSGIIWVDGNGGISKQCFWSSSGDNDLLI